jgi:hypothetical protein
MKAYYAHPITIYNTPVERNDVKTLTDLGYTVINPNEPQHELAYQERGMPYFLELVRCCDLLVFRAFPDGSIPAGVYGEIQAAYHELMPVLEMPNGVEQRMLTVKQTREFLYQNGRDY